MGTKIEVFDFKRKAWVHTENITPGKYGYFAQNLPDGERKIYQLTCESDDQHTIIASFKAGALETADDVINEVNRPTHEVIILKQDDKPFNITFLQDNTVKRRLVRLSHVPGIRQSE